MTHPRAIAVLTLVLALLASACTGHDETWSASTELRQLPTEASLALGDVEGAEGRDAWVDEDAYEDAWVGVRDTYVAAEDSDALAGDASADDVALDDDSALVAAAVDAEEPLGTVDAGLRDRGLQAAITWEAWWEDDADTSVAEDTGPEDTAAAWVDTAVAGDDAWSEVDTVVDDDTFVAEDTAAAVDTIVPAPPGMVVEWCRMMHPAAYVAAPGEGVEIAGHVHVPGQTDETLYAPDPAPWLIGEVGYGPTGSRPDQGASPWGWTRAHVDPDPPSWVFYKHDRYLADLAIDEPGLWDYAVRFSADGGASWKYCDLDGSFDGYEPAEAGAAEITE